MSFDTPSPPPSAELQAYWDESADWTAFVTVRGRKYAQLEHCRRAALQSGRPAAKKQMVEFANFRAVRRLTR